MFKGTFFHSLDEKGRIAIPNKLRQQMDKTGDSEILVITQGFERCLFAYPLEEWKEIELKAKKLSILDKASQDFIRFFISPANECVLDKLGRIMLPQNLRDYAGISREAVILGAAGRIEIWSKENWDRYQLEFRNNEKDFIKQMKDIGL